MDALWSPALSGSVGKHNPATSQPGAHIDEKDEAIGDSQGQVCASAQSVPS